MYVLSNVSIKEHEMKGKHLLIKNAACISSKEAICAVMIQSLTAIYDKKLQAFACIPQAFDMLTSSKT
ncbi:uncharacterized protein PHALS_15436 [Plasmopara halstedii]|uniref:Uncharacterized protein n=1 Tax=Plasmopara halstedii TaxID=4781 RepID=A0A0P1AHT8_PLAHL|nr:uncharacterized protein PHALS_15436 [Plasmopara halstedii]CEG40281.1 hypothetical protein PHALS_15436 [Plasmopara halstedii]|eukprot:XP_024576650.1 hypothetical protein PHALS_15436 [Plasmopara halstedii]